MQASPYEVDVRPILEDLGSTIEVDADVPLPPMVLGDETYPLAGPAAVSLIITNTGAGIVASGSVRADLEARCSRCLREFTLAVTGDVEGFYVTPGAEHDLPEEQEYGFVREGAVDLTDALLSALALEVPFAPLHDPGCAGICATCGVDLNVTACSCPPPAPDSPFAALKALLPEDEDGP